MTIFFFIITPLFEVEAFHTGNYTEIVTQTKKPP